MKFHHERIIAVLLISTVNITTLQFLMTLTVPFRRSQDFPQITVILQQICIIVYGRDGPVMRGGFMDPTVRCPTVQKRPLYGFLLNRLVDTCENINYICVLPRNTPKVRRLFHCRYCCAAWVQFIRSKCQVLIEENVGENILLLPHRTPKFHINRPIGRSRGGPQRQNFSRFHAVFCENLIKSYHDRLCQIRSSL